MNLLRARTRRAAALLALTAAGAALALGVAEIALRLFLPQTLLHDPDAFVTDPLLGGRLKPGFTDTFSSPEYKTLWEINAAGHRGPAAGVKGGGVERIAVLGDSFTFGYGVEEREAYPAVMASVLESRAPGRYEVVNLGVGGYGTSQEVAWLRENLGRGLAPDIVILGFYCGNDLSDSLRGRLSTGALAAGLVDGGAAPAQPSWLEAWKRHLGSRWHLYSLVSDRLDGLLVRAGLRRVVYPEEVDVLRSPEPDSVRRGWEAAAESLRDLRSLAGEAGFTPLVAGIPMRHQVVPASWDRVQAYYRRLTGRPLEDVDLDRPALRLAAICESTGLRLIDLTGPFREAGNPARLYFGRDQHWTKGGHRLAAESLSDAALGLPGNDGTRTEAAALPQG